MTITECSTHTGTCFWLGGECVNSTYCSCYPPWTGESCDVSIADYFGAGFYAYQYGFAIAFTIVTLLATIQLIFQPHRSNTHTALFGVLIFEVATRALFLFLDPYNVRRIVPRVLNEILYGVTVWAIISSYLLVLSLWIETYIKTTTEYFERDNKLAKLRTVIWVFIAVLFVVNVVQDGVRSVYGGGSTRPIVLAVYTGVNAIIAIVTSTIYLIYGRKLYVRLLKFKTSGIGADYIRRVTFLTTACCIMALLLVVVLTTVTIVYFSQPTSNPTFFFIYHSVYRLMELAWCICLMSIFHVRLQNIKDKIAPMLQRPLLHD